MDHQLEENPNIVLIVMDTARADFVDNSLPAEVTPNIANVAEEGTVFSNSFSSAPWTLPSHASIFTGAYSSKHGAHAGHKRLENDLIRLPEVFEEAGYTTVGMSNNQWISEDFGFDTGFNEFYKGWQRFQTQSNIGGLQAGESSHGKWNRIARQMLSGNTLLNLANGLHSKLISNSDNGAKRTTLEFKNQLSNGYIETPFFCFINFLEPHLDYQPPKSYAKEFLPADVSFDNAMDVPQRPWEFVTNQLSMSDKEFDILESLYKAELNYLDKKIGEIVKKLKREGEWDNTIFTIIGDHGENIGDHGLMDHQYCLYDTLIHVPTIVSGGSFDNGETIDPLVQLVDIAPTLVEEAGIEAPKFDSQCQGIPMQSNSEREYIISEYMAPQPSVDAIESRVGDPNNVMKKYNRSLRSIRTKDYKVIRGSDGTIESINLGNRGSGVPSEIEEELIEKLDHWVQSSTNNSYDGSVDVSRKTKKRLEDMGYI
ncbi:sulfatase [Halomicrococcus sp. NG-SE-24]|uniref:sulfatase n=1 Tax=Halomicrococcus sp. NG-SE-24 TaxID=3436928 RepID=UPI003D984457